jgi:hypothetical protein
MIDSGHPEVGTPIGKGLTGLAKRDRTTADIVREAVAEGFGLASVIKLGIASTFNYDKPQTNRGHVYQSRDVPIPIEKHPFL